VKPLCRLALAAVLAALTASPAWAGVTKIEGEYQLMMAMRKDLRMFPWQFDSNDGSTSNPFQVRLFTQPAAGLEGFLKVEARWNRGDNREFRPEFHYQEAHAGWRRESGGRGFDAKVFSRQNRFWVDNYLIKFADVNRGDAQGVRLDTWGYWNTNVSFIAADISGQMDPENLLASYDSRFGIPPPYAPRDSLVRQASLRTDDIYVLRVRREFLKDRKLRLGFTWNRYEGWAGRDSISDRTAWNSVFGFDSRYRLGPSTDISFEYGFSHLQEGNLEDQSVTFFGRRTPLKFPDRAVAQFELRSLQIGTPRLGYLNVAPAWWMRGPLYLNSLGGPGSDETGFLIQSWYLLPDRAITVSSSYLRYEKKYAARQNEVREFYNELYVEFVNGFTGKTYYKRRDEYETDRNFRLRDTYLSWVNELQVESWLAWLRVQSKLQNLGRADAKQLFVIENRINLTDKTKVYSRFALGNDPSRLRKGVFVQLQYRPTGNMEVFLQYGPDYIGGGSNPVEEGNLAGSGDQFDEVKFILKGTF
jgi:hypothetical protein